MAVAAPRRAVILFVLALSACPPAPLTDAGPEVDAGSTFLLTVVKSGNGSGSVASTPAGIDCGADCSKGYLEGTLVTLTATADSTTRFLGWTGGGCEGTGPCVVPVSEAVTVSAAFALENSLVVAVVGSGSVSSTPAGIDCGASCVARFTRGTVVSLTATPTAGFTLVSWSNGCSITVPCVVTLGAAAMVTATFGPQQVPLTVVKAGSGRGVVSSSPTGLDCGARCVTGFDLGAQVTLTATASSGSTFTGWSGACTGTSTCTLSLSAAAEVVATFEVASHPVTVALTGAGAGAVSSSPPGIDCGVDCTETWFAGTTVLLTATPAPGSLFTGWSGACTGTEPCMVLGLDAVTDVTATFALESYLLTVAPAGPGSGLISSSPAGIACGSDCTESWSSGTSITLTATPAVGSLFTGWSGGGCTGTGACVITPTEASTVVPTFAIQQFPLDVTLTGNGVGVVTSAPAGISCGTGCSAPYDYGTTVVLTATPEPGTRFDGWSGACTGTADCTVSITAATSVSALFTGLPAVVTVSLAGTGLGTVSSTPAGISCDGDCSEVYAFGTMVSLTATPTAGSSFTGWSGDCLGTGPCVLNATTAKNVTASFTITTHSITVVRTGPFAANGLVTSAPAGIDCGTDCSETWDYGTTVVLTATPAPGETFTGWSSGGCSGLGPCTLNVTAAATVTATFGVIPVVRVGYPTPLGGFQNVSRDYLLGERITLPNPVTLVKFGVLVGVAGPQARFSLYANAGSLPGALLAQTATVTLTSGAMEVDPTEANVALPAGTYWFMANYETTANIGFGGASNTIVYRSLPFGSAIPNPYGAATSYTSQTLNYYLVVQ